MLLVGGKDKLSLLSPPKDSKVGSLILPLKYLAKPEVGLKKNALTKLLPYLKVGKNSKCFFKDVPLLVGEEEVFIHWIRRRIRNKINFNQKKK